MNNVLAGNCNNKSRLKHPPDAKPSSASIALTLLPSPYLDSRLRDEQTERLVRLDEDPVNGLRSSVDERHADSVVEPLRRRLPRQAPPLVVGQRPGFAGRGESEGVGEVGLVEEEDGVGEGAEKVVRRMVAEDDRLAHGQCFCGRGAHNIRDAGVEVYFVGGEGRVVCRLGGVGCVCQGRVGEGGGNCGGVGACTVEVDVGGRVGAGVVGLEQVEEVAIALGPQGLSQEVNGECEGEGCGGADSEEFAAHAVDVGGEGVWEGLKGGRQANDAVAVAAADPGVEEGEGFCVARREGRGRDVGEVVRVDDADDEGEEGLPRAIAVPCQVLRLFENADVVGDVADGVCDFAERHDGTEGGRVDAVVEDDVEGGGDLGGGPGADGGGLGGGRGEGGRE